MPSFPVLDIPNLALPTLFDQDKGYFAVGFPESYLIPQILPFLQEVGGRVKDTSFNKVDVNINNLDFIDGGIAVFGDARLQHRELLWEDRWTGKHYTDWISVSGSFRLAVNAGINDEVLQVGYRDHQLSFDGKWYSEIADVLVDSLFKDKIVEKIKSALSDFNGLSIRQLFDKFGSKELQQKLAQSGVDSAKIDAMLSKVKVGAKFSETDLWVSADFSNQ
ncbi:hypothetical protein QUB75_04505 [Microcoleus sp. K1-B6]|uniref:hypothetical protein n=1 Tax=unclassified Microcoleus TaxID=2642155 RepID=UPI002FCEC351